MAQILQTLRSYMSAPTYDRLYKKDEDLGVEPAQSWVNNFPLRKEEIKSWDYEYRQIYIERLLKALKSFPITSANKELVETHLATACKSDDTMRLFIKKHFNIDEMKGTQSVIERIQSRIISIVSC